MTQKEIKILIYFANSDTSIGSHFFQNWVLEITEELSCALVSSCQDNHYTLHGKE